MPRSYSRDRYQPALFDRLEDQLGSILADLVDARARLERLLDNQQRQALSELLGDERLPNRAGDERHLLPFKMLAEEGQALLRRVLDGERSRRLELNQTMIVSRDRLREAVLRDLEHLLNTTRAEIERQESWDDDGFSAFPAVNQSVLNYGIPPFGGRIHTPRDLNSLGRAIEMAVSRFEPRLHHVRVRAANSEQSGTRPLTMPVAFIMEAELWGHPYREQLLLRTILDPDHDRITVEVDRRDGEP